jgi:1-acyl-sn-glycerol-3-phosphate acyltransferase
MITSHPALLVAGCALGIFALYRLVFWTVQAFLVMRPGHITPTPSTLSILLRVLLGRLMLFLFTGPVTVIGASNTDFFGRLIAFGPHQTQRDALVALWLMGARPTRYFIADNQARGMLSWLVAYTGGIVVYTDSPTASAAAMLAAIRAMRTEKNASFVIFPQGMLKPDNVLNRVDYKNGTVLLGKYMSRDSEGKASYLPFAIHYDRDPAHATPFHRALNKCGIKWFRRFYGETVYRLYIVVGAPIPTEIMPDDLDAATDAIFDQSCVLTLQAQRLAAGFKPDDRK